MLKLLLTVFLVMLNGFFVATEFAIVKVRSTRIKELAENGNVSAKQASEMLRHLDAYLSASQLGITLASLALGWVGESVVAEHIIGPLFARLHVQSHALEQVISFAVPALAFLLITFAHIVYGEQAPKMLAIQRAERTTLWVARPIAVFYWIFRPFIAILNSASNASVRLLGIDPLVMHEMAHTEEELRMIITASGTDHGGTLRETQAELLDNVFDFGHRLARQIMRHRTEIEVLDIADTLAENVRAAQEGGHTRYPVIEGDIDTVIGFVHTKDLFALYQRDTEGDMRTVLRDVLLVPEAIRVDLLLRQMQRKRQNMAVLVDEYGGTAGLVTVADVLEELVGELPDEFEPAEEEWVVQVDPQTWNVDGRLPLTDLEELLDRELPCEEACDTVGGYVFWAFGRIPETGDTLERDGIALRVLDMDGRRVSHVEIVLQPAHPEEDDAVENAALARGGR